MALTCLQCMHAVGLMIHRFQMIPMWEYMPILKARNQDATKSCKILEISDDEMRFQNERTGKKKVKWEASFLQFWVNLWTFFHGGCHEVKEDNGGTLGSIDWPFSLTSFSCGAHCSFVSLPFKAMKFSFSYHFLHWSESDEISVSLIKLVAMIDFRSRGFRIQFSGLLIKVLGCSVNNDGYIGMPCNSFGKLNRISQSKPFFSCSWTTKNSRRIKVLLVISLIENGPYQNQSCLQRRQKNLITIL